MTEYERTVTMYVPHDANCPPLYEWPMRSLIEGTCPRCGKYEPRAWRMAKAHRLVRRFSAATNQTPEKG